ncbi:mediator of RNA polymerase II transcription subunit 1-like [Trichomycterus rosablanca]|uniref:mediator of RNA polymerase II transcription subunit 1-like n=1 Tax=Trichomycterus rosablanca TaxID=2290929 RepID=UPI002F35C72B
MEASVDVKRKPNLSKLTSKYADKPWSETFQLVHRCMEKAKADGEICEPIMRCLQKLQEVQNVTSVSAMVTRLEMIAKQKGLGSHLSPTETACYLTADLFYVEVLLHSGGEVKDVKVAQHGEAPESNTSLLQLLRMKKFEEFSLKLDDLASLYNIPGDNDTKIKVYTALQHLQKDLLKISNLPRSLKENDVHVDMVLNGRIGSVTPCREGNPMVLQYYISRSDALINILHPGEGSLAMSAKVVVSASATTHRLQMESLIPSPPQVDSLGFPVFSPLSEKSTEYLPAFFLLKLQPPVPMLSSFIHRMSQITGICPDADLQREPLIQLLQRTILEDQHKKSSSEGKESHFLKSLPDGELHSYFFALLEWNCDSWKGALIHTVPFTHPAHVPALLAVLRHQSAINVLLASCITNFKRHPGLVCELSCEILPESDCSFSVTVGLPGSDSLAVLFVSVTAFNQVCCKLLMAGLVDPSLDNYISRVLTRCMSIPITMRAIRKRISSLRIPAQPLSEPDSTPVAEGLPSTLPHRAEENSPAILSSAPNSPEPMEQEELPSNPSHYVMSVAATAAVDCTNTEVIANRSPCASVGVYSHWVASSIPAELI